MADQITDVGLGNALANGSLPAYISSLHNISDSASNGSAALEDCNITVSSISHTYRIYRITIDVFFVGFLSVFGLIGNALSIVVLRRDRDKKNTTNWLLQTLALSDTLYLIACVFFQVVKGVNDMTDWCPGLKQVFPYMEPYIWAFASITQTITVWLVMLVTVDRYIAVCKPLKTQLRTIQRAKLAVAIVIILAILYNIPRFLEREISFSRDKCTGLTKVKSGKTSLRNNKIYFLVYKTIMYFVFRTIGPLIILVGLNLRLIKALQEVRRKHRDLTKSNKHRENITLMLVVVVSVFIVCELPDLSLRIIFSLREFFEIKTLDIPKLRYYNCITNALLTVNSSTNFLIYCLIGHKFRKILRQMCCRHIRSNVMEISETEPLNTRTTNVSSSKNGALQKNGPHVVRNGGKTEAARDGDIAL